MTLDTLIMSSKTNDSLKIGNVEFCSRLFVGTGKYRTNEDMASAIEASETEMVTVAIRRVDLKNPDANILNHLDFTRYRFLPNTAGARTAEEAVQNMEAGLTELSDAFWADLEPLVRDFYEDGFINPALPRV